MLEDLPPIQESLKQFGLTANKALGQHFLFDLNLTRKIARAAGANSGDIIMEVGPGPGGLTRALLESGAQLIAVDKDTRFAPLLQSIQDASKGRLVVKFEDALNTNESAFYTHGKTFKIVSNLPYNVGTMLLIKWLTATPIMWSSLTLMFQKEVAERVVAPPCAAAYGRLAVLVAAIADAHYLFGIPATAFTPPPKVDSAVVHLTPKPVDQRFDDLAGLEQITRTAFGQRRKMLRASLKPFAKAAGLEVENWLEEAGISPTDRPETVAPSGFFTLTKIWRSAGKT